MIIKAKDARKLTVVCVLFAFLMVLGGAAFAADGAEFSLRYRAKNEWVHMDEIRPLRGLIKEMKKRKTGYVQVVFPQKGRELSVRRAVILKDILVRHLKRDVIVEEVDGDVGENLIKAKVGG